MTIRDDIAAVRASVREIKAARRNPDPSAAATPEPDLIAAELDLWSVLDEIHEVAKPQRRPSDAAAKRLLATAEISAERAQRVENHRLIDALAREIIRKDGGIGALAAMIPGRPSQLRSLLDPEQTKHLWALAHAALLARGLGVGMPEFWRMCEAAAAGEAP